MFTISNLPPHFLFFTLGMGVFLLGLIATYLCHPLAELISFIDDPDNIRKFHHIPTPSTGGIGMAVAFSTGLALILLYAEHLLTDSLYKFIPYFAASGAIIVLTGIKDDFHGLSSKPKFFMQTMASLIIIVGLHNTYFVTHSSVLGWGYAYQVILYALFALWIVSNCNSINLIDGVDALAGSVSLSIIAGIGALAFMWSVVDVVPFLIPMGFAIAAFLLFNRPPASIFMGDSGSMLIGLTLAVCSIIVGLQAPHWMYGLSLIILFGMPLSDTILSIVRRLKSSMNPFESDSNHLHHVIQRYYKSPYMAVFIMTSLSTIFVILGVLLANTNNATLFFAAYGLLLALFLLTTVIYSYNLDKSSTFISHPNISLGQKKNGSSSTSKNGQKEHIVM